MTRPPFLLCILDGVGLNPSTEGNAVAAANTPVLDELLRNSPSTTLTTFGPAVGLPERQMGNSEVGHLNIGAGRVVKQWLLRISDSFTDGSVKESTALKNFTNSNPEAPIHLVGLSSFGGVHSNLNHLFSLIEELLTTLPKAQFILHIIGDGRDVPPNQLLLDLDKIEERLAPYSNQITIGSWAGRFYTMDRDKRWERTEEGYNAIVGNGDSSLCTSETPFSEVIGALKKEISESYEKNITDEFLKPRIIQPHSIADTDKVIFWNFRSDRMRQIVQALIETDSQEEFLGFKRSTSPFKAQNTLCFAEYDQTFGLPVLFPSETIANHLGEVLSKAGLTQLRVAETEKYPHVTYFLNGGDEIESPGEERLLVPSPRDVKTYDQKPEMSALEITEGVLADIQNRKHDFIVLNFANGDMVGHTGVIEAAIKAVETVDNCLGKILEALKAVGGTALVIADHGNAEQMIDPETGGPHTAHTTHPVPCILVAGDGKSYSLRSSGALCDVAPTVLGLLGLEQPTAMTGKSLIL